MQESQSNAGPSTGKKCPLFDSVDQRHETDVKEAYQKALADYKRDHPDVDVRKDINIDLPRFSMIDAEAQAQNARDSLTSALDQQRRAHALEDSLQARLAEVEAGLSMGLVARRKRAFLRLMPRALDPGRPELVRLLSDAKTARVSADRRVHAAEEAVEKAEKRLADLRREAEEQS